MTLGAASAAVTDDQPTYAFARRLRAPLRLQAVAVLHGLITYRNAVQGMLFSPLHTIHQITVALEQPMAADAVIDRPFIADMVVSKWRCSSPTPGVFNCAARLGGFAGDRHAWAGP